MSWEGDSVAGVFAKRLSTLLVATLLLGGCGHEEAPPEVPAEDASLGAESAEEAAPGPEAAQPAAVSLEDIPFQPAGTFPHGEHRRIDCTSCHGSVPGHGSHSSVSCTDCHGVPQDYAALPVRSQAECMSCHHDPSRTGGCDQCHGSAPRESLEVPATIRMSVWSQQRTRTLSFEHQRHGELECSTCHGEVPGQAPARECQSCHQEHHRPEASCGTCHAPEAGPYHGEEVHVGCSGSECHRDPTVTSLPASRPLCLVCHQEQTQHEVEGLCTECHLVGGFVPTGATRGGGAR